MVEVCKFNEGYVMDWINKKLGAPAVCVELEETQLKYIIDDVIELFQEYRPKEFYVGQQYQRGYHYITAPEDAIGILDVEFVRNDYQSYESIEGALLYDPFYFLSAGGISGIDVQTYDLVRHWTEIIAREFGSEEGYIPLDDGNLYMQVPGTFDVTFKWAMPWTGLCDMHRPYQQIFLKLALAKAMVVLGNIRGKFSQGVPGAGGMVQLDGDWMRQQGLVDEEKYTEELKRISPHFLPSLG